MDNTVFSIYKIEDRSYLSFIKREMHNLVGRAGFSSMRTGEVDIVVAELTSNLIKHANEGALIYRLMEEDNNKAFEIFCIDSGPGTDHILRMMKDGASSANTLGHGLGSIKRLSNFFQIYSREGWGTVAYAKIYMHPPGTDFRARNQLQLKPLQLCCPGERVCGDGYYVKKMPEETRIFLGDGLGHGPLAHEAVAQAIDAFKECKENNPAAILRFIHQHVTKTRGLVGSVVILDHERKIWKISGVGNIITRLYQGTEAVNVVSHNGIIGLNFPNTLEYNEIDANRYQSIVMYSDGIRHRWSPDRHPSLFSYDASIIASAVFKDNARHNDDMTILVGKLIA